MPPSVFWTKKLARRLIADMVVTQRTNCFSAAEMSNNLDSRFAASVPGGPPNSFKQFALSGALWIGFENRS